MVKEFACRRCKILTTSRICHNCNSKDMAFDWSGFIIIYDVERSLVAKILKIEKPGKYALKVS